jgi:hypothetical protein
VPKLDKGKLTLSSIILSRREQVGDQTNRSNTIESNKPLSNASRTKTARVVSAKTALGVKFYRSNDSLVYQLMVYNSKKREPELLIRSEIFQGEAAVYQGEFQSLSSRIIRADKKGVEAGGQIELAGLDPGIYELRVAIKESKSKQTTRQSIIFGVEP